MSLTKTFQKKVRAVQVRCSLNLLLQQTGRILAVAGIVAALAILVQRLLALIIVTPAVLWGFWGIAVAVVLALWFLRLPSRMQVSVLLDERLGLRERFSTTLALAQSDDPFASAARRESLAAIQRADLRGHFPIGLSRSWYYGAGTWLIVIALVLLMPQKDLLGLLKERKQQEQQTKQVEQAQAEVKQTTEAVKAVVEKLDDPALDEELKKLEGLAQAGQPQEIRREAIKTLGDLSDRLKQMQGNSQIGAANMMQQMLQRLRGSTDPFSQQIRTALAKGDFAQAANLLGQLQKDLASGKLSEQQRRDVAQQLQQLAKELQKLAEQKRDLEQELEKLGLDKKLAQMDEQQLRQALQQQGLKQEQIEQLMKKAAASQAAAGKCSGLAQAMGACGSGAGGLSADELSEAMEQLDEVSRFISELGQGMCQGPGSQAPWQEGLSNKFGSGSGGPGMGFGPRDSDTDGKTATKATRTRNASGDGPVIASWYFKDTQTKGEARRDFTEVVQAGRANAAEAISENQIPRKYEDTVKKYFGELEQRGKATPKQP